jgi:hypothetical protein
MTGSCGFRTRASLCSVQAALAVAVALTSLLLTPCPAVAATDWTYATSDHFEIYTTAGSRRAREALTYFERVHAFFADYLKISPRNSIRTRLILFSNEREFRPYRFNDIAVAYYRQGPDRDYVVMESLGDEAYPIVVHEYAHLLMRHSGVRYPLWLNEGYAEFFSTLAPYGGQMSIGRVPEGRLAYLASGQRLFDLERLFAVTYDSPEYRSQNHAGVFYSQSWALTHMLLTSERYRPLSGRFLDLIDSDVPSATAMAQVYGRSLREVLSDLSSYVHGDRFTFFTAKYKAPDANARYPERKVPAFEAGLMIANLLAAGRDTEVRARDAFDALARENGDDLSLAESRAYFEWRTGHRDRAMPWLARAVELGSKSARLYRDYATLITEPGQNETLLRQALALDPDDVDVRIRLAHRQLDRHESAEALLTLAPITRPAPEDGYNVAQLRANAYLRLKNLPAARASAAEALRLATTPAALAYGEQLTRAIEDIATNEALVAKILAEQAMAKNAVPPAPEPTTFPPELMVSERQSLDGRELEFVRGRLRNVTCGESPTIDVQVEQRTMRFAIDAPKLVRVLGAGATAIDLQCGAQDRRLRVGFFRPDRPVSQSAGSVRVLDYR